MDLFDTSIEGGVDIFDVSRSSPEMMIQVNCHIDNGAFDQSSMVVVDPMGHAPTITFQRRLPPNSATGGLWRLFNCSLDNAEGRKPVFKVSRQYRDGNGLFNLATWRGVRTQDFLSWSQSDTPVSEGGSAGTWNITFPDPLPAGVSYVAHTPYGRQQEADAFAEWLLVDNAAIASPANVAYTGGNYGNSVVENNDIGMPVGGLPRYAIKLSFPGPTTDGLRKRKIVSMYGIHAAGEGQAWWPFVEGIKWVITSPDLAAQNLRANWDFYLYFNVNPNGIKAGQSRVTPRNNSDPNRNWSTLGNVSSLEEVDSLKRVIHSDVEGQCDAFYSWHGDVYSTSNFQTWVWTSDYNSGTRGATMQAMITAGTTIWGKSPVLSTSSTDNTDVWFGRAVLQAPISFDCESPSMASSGVAFYSDIGKKWYQALEVVDQAGGVLIPDGPVVLTGRNVRQVNRTTVGHMSDGTLPTWSHDDLVSGYTALLQLVNRLHQFNDGSARDSAKPGAFSVTEIEDAISIAAQAILKL